VGGGGSGLGGVGGVGLDLGPGAPSRGWTRGLREGQGGCVSVSVKGGGCVRGKSGTLVLEPGEHVSTIRRRD